MHRWRPADHVAQAWSLEERPACLGLHAQGGLVCALESRVVHLQVQHDRLVELASLGQIAHPRPGMRLNDGRCDRQGRFWVGSMVMNMALATAAGQLYRLDADGMSSIPLDPLVVPNGLAFSPNGDTLYLSDSHPSVRKIWAFKLHADGKLSDRRLFVDMGLHPGRPDGAAVDTDGCYWTCANDAGLVHRFTPAGVLDRSIAVPVSKPSMCAFGGANMDELFITSIRPPSPPPGEVELAGATFVCRPGAQGLPETPFGARTASAPIPSS